MTDNTVPPPSTPAAPPRRHRGLWAIVIVALAGVAVGVVLVVMALAHWRTSAGAPVSVTAKPSDQTRHIHAILFYVSNDGTALVQASREVPYGDTPTEQARLLAEAELAPAPSGMLSPIPAGTTVRSIFLAPHGEAYVDVSQDIVSGGTGGSLDETLTVYAIVDAIAVNMPDISAVQILVDGHAVDSLAGHLDLRHPLARSFRWVQKAQ